MDAEQTSQVLQRLQVLELAATEQLNARRGAERALVEALNRILAQQLERWWILVYSGGRTRVTAARRHGPTGVS